ncbi:uncharacterized protein LOC112127340 [Cimex lectularius]|uniref:RNase H type-1 domain-containing protein n=1 Tax=Cimex lectularius TaxID=79782 RepID=A0A8I6SRM2_CIMLE|nr:uncharacterized protein LOC112127340 [Cimex lectularius]
MADRTVAKIVNCAELLAINKCLNIIALTRNHLILCTDSLSAVYALKDIFSLNPLVHEIHSAIKDFYRKNLQVTVMWIPGHCGITGNVEADKAARSAQREGHKISEVPQEDFVTHVKAKTKEKWQLEWFNTRENKLRAVKADIRLWTTSARLSRKEECVLARLRIGHTRITHGYLMAREPPPMCVTCGVLTTVKHILLECKMYRRARMSSELPASLPELLNDRETTVSRLFKFLRETELFGKI